MIENSISPNGGTEVEGYHAALSTGLKPRFWHYHVYDGQWQMAYVMVFIAIPLGILSIWLGTKIMFVHNLHLRMPGLALWLLGGMALLLAPAVAMYEAWLAHAWVKWFRDGLLIPGVVVSRHPLAIVGLADMGKDDESKGKEFAVARAALWSLPGYPHDIGTRVPCIAHFSCECKGRYLYFEPYPVCYGIGDHFDLELCAQRIGEASFQRLDALVARGLVPADCEQMYVIDRNDERIETRAFADASELRESPGRKKVQAEPQAATNADQASG